MKFKLLNFQFFFQIVTDLKFSLFIFAIIAVVSALGSVIEQEESIEFYQEKYGETHPIYGFLTWKVIQIFGLDHIYTTTLFFFLLLLLTVCLISCTLVRQLPTFFVSKHPFFKKQSSSFPILSFYIRIKNLPYLQEIFVTKMQPVFFFLFQKKNLIYGYKGLIGRIGPILVHFSLIFLLFGTWWSALDTLKAQEILRKGEIFHLQNSLRVGSLTSLPTFPIRINDFWVEYKEKKIFQFYSNLSILNNVNQEAAQRTISVNSPLHFDKIDIYQSDWNILGIRVKDEKKKEIFQLPFFSLQEGKKSWVSWLSKPSSKERAILETDALILDQLENVLFIYRGNQFQTFLNVNDPIDTNSIGNEKSFRLIEILPVTGLLIKSDPSLEFIYIGFAALMITTLLSFLPYTQIWLLTQPEKDQVILGGATNRGKLNLELLLENLLRWLEKRSRQKTTKKILSNC